MSVMSIILVGFLGALPILLTKTGGKKTCFIALLILSLVYTVLGLILFNSELNPTCPWLNGYISFITFWWCLTAIISGIIEYYDEGEEMRLRAAWPAIIALLFMAIY